MELQILFDTFASIFGVVLGWLLKVVWDSVKDLQSNQRDIESDLHNMFVRKEDFKDALGKIEVMVSKIFDKLDEKQDKSRRTNK